EAGERLLDVGLRWIGEAEEAVEGEVAFVVAAEMLERHPAAGDGNDTRTGGEESVEGGLGLPGDICAAGKDAFGGALGNQQPALRCVDQDRGELALVVKREPVESRPTNLVVLGCDRGGMERAVEFVAGLVAAGQAEREDLLIDLAVPVERLSEGDVTFGQRACLV